MDKKTNPAKEWLMRYQAMQIRQESMIRSIEAAEERTLRCTYVLKPIHVQGGSGAYDRMAEDVVGKLDGQVALKSSIAEIEEALKEVVETIDRIERAKKDAADRAEWEKAVLQLRYVEGLKWDDVIQKLPYEKTAVHEIHGTALLKVNKMLKKRTLSDTKV